MNYSKETTVSGGHDMSSCIVQASYIVQPVEQSKT